MDPIPHIVGRYACYGEIAAGGMAAVHYGRLIGPAGFSRIVAIKRLHTHFARDPGFVSMFLDEARMAARIRHPNVVATTDVINVEGELLLVMDYVPGESLARLAATCRTRNHRPPLEVISAIACGVLNGLHAAHEATDQRGNSMQLVHRDVSPQNVLIGADGVPRLIDFGIAKATGRSNETRHGEVKGKVAYMAPEQLLGEPVDRRADVYAAGVVLWEVLTLRRMFTGKNEWTLLNSVMKGHVPPPSATVPALPSGLDALVMRAIDRDPAKRFDSAHQMALALEAIVPGASTVQMSQWVQELAGEALAARAKVAAQVESDEEGLACASMGRHSQGAEQSLEQLVDVLAPRLYEYLLQDLGCTPAAAGRAVKETLLKMHAARGAFSSGAHVISWARAVAARVEGVGEDEQTKSRPAKPRARSTTIESLEVTRQVPVPPELKQDVIAYASKQPSLTRPQLLRQLAVYVGASLVIAMSVFFSQGGLRDWPQTRPGWFIIGGALGWMLAAISATWGALGRGRGMLGGTSRQLLLVSILTPMVMFGWMTIWGASCPGSWPSRIGFKCMWFTLAVGVLPLFALIRARRGTDPTHPTATGGALGAAAGAWSGVIVDLWCPIATASHVLIGHILPMVILTGVGGLLGRYLVGVPRGGGLMARRPV